MSTITGIINEDGTDFNPPKNPLQKKWDRLYPPNQRHKSGENCEGYSCMYCDKCPNGSYWKVPQEDKEEWEKHIKEVHKYLKDHNPTIYCCGKLKSEVNS